MPIKPENRARYPDNWKQIREQILERAGNCCEQCKVRNHSIVQRGWLNDRDTYRDVEDGTVRDAETGAWLGWVRESDYCGDAVKIVLTIAHLDHEPENCDPANLRALCQLHHLRYDAKHHAANARETRRARKAIGDLFDEPQPIE
ncbi:hypothetical protein [Burkholderia sp. Ax-1719]|uniref:hypothetical protein n=1 Tax=Burkholderia sp. Ax-1719 TaxID=2608334 RepID=UPI001423F98D|nr:hypothetical protein [Burkholderia sp. Ax-1719]NIE67440.1 hypothetical protein [Burkholderia sp. Ax-1719]